jgi:capsular polysaccharide biosynthesis protein
MLSEIKDFVKRRFYDIILFIIIVLLVMLAFSAGYIVAKYQSKTPIQITNQNKL